MQIIDLAPDNIEAIRQTAELLFKSFGKPGAWPTIESALEEVKDSLADGCISRVAVDAAGNVIGWIGGICKYDGNVWELHPLSVSAEHREKGIGRALVNDFESVVREHGGITVTLGTDDLENQTTLGGMDVYPDVWRHIKTIQNLRRHPYEFYQKLGYVIVGVLPDANGLGKPDIFMAKRVIP
ncbi:aminoglycoside N-acetyltransferase AAC(6')-Ii [soil metagenome]